MVLLRPSDIAKLYGFSVSQIRRLIREGVIKAEKVGTYYVINEKNLRSIKRRRKQKQTQDE